MSNPLKRTCRGNDATGRSKGQQKHVRLHRWMMRSAAWKALSLPARCLLIEFYDLYDGANNGDIFMSVRQAATRLGISVNFARKTLGEIEEKGFARPRQRGGFDLKTKQATTWILTEFEFAGQPPTKDFMRWQLPATVSSGDTVAEIGQPTKKQNTVSPGDKDGITGRYRGRDRRPENTPDGITGRYREAQNRPATVSPGDTQVVYQGGGPGNGNAPSPSPPAKRQQRQRVGTKPNGRQIDLEEAIEAAAAESKAIPTNFGETANGGKRPWSTPRIIAAPHDARTFGLWLAEERGRLGMTAARAGAITKLGEDGIGNVEAGRATVGKAMRRKIVKALASEARP